MGTPRVTVTRSSLRRLTMVGLSLLLLTACGGGSSETAVSTSAPSSTLDIAVQPLRQTAVRGASATSRIKLSDAGALDNLKLDLSGNPLLSTDRAPGNIAYRFAIDPGAGEVTLTFDVGRNVPTGDYKFTLNAALGEQNGALPLTLTITTQPLGPGRWEELPDTHMREVCPPRPPFGTNGCESVIRAWGGGALDPDANKLYLFGGGHDNYYGNEVYAFDLGTRVWQRVSDPTPPAADADRHCYASWDGGKTPTARHTYNNLAWIAHLHKLFLYGGVTSCEEGGSQSDTWLFDPGSATWERLATNSPVTNSWVQVIYDPASRHVYTKMSRLKKGGGLYRFDFAGNQWKTLAETTSNDDPLALKVLFRTGTLDTKRHQIWFIGVGTVSVLPISPDANPTIRTVTTTGATAILNTESPGIAYDPVRDRIVAWCGGDERCGSKDAGTAALADQVYSLDPQTLEWAVDQPPNGPSAWAQQRGTFGRWRYSPKSDVFIAVNSVDGNVWFYHPPEVR